jgi:hypothetical protein
MPYDLAGIDRQETDDRFQQRRLAGAIGADEPQHLAVAHGEADIAQRRLIAVPLGQRNNLKHGCRFTL